MLVMTWNSPAYLLSFLLCFTCYPEVAHANDSLYFQKIYTQINENIEQGFYSANFPLLKEISATPAFRQLPCHLKGKIYHRIGVSYYLVNREQQAVELFKDSALFSWQNCPEITAIERANTQYTIGISYQYLNQPLLAQKYLNEALLVFETDSSYHPFDLAEVYQGLGNFYRDNHDSFRATLYYQNALSLYKKFPETEMYQFEVYSNLLLVQAEIHQDSLALHYFHQALELAQTYPAAISKSDLFSIHHNLGAVYEEMGKLSQALPYHYSSLPYADREEDSLFFSLSLELGAALDIRQNDPTSAIEALEEVIAIRTALLTNVESYIYLAEGYAYLCKAHLAKENHPAAESALQQAFKALLWEPLYDSTGTPIIRHTVAKDERIFIRLLKLKSDLFQSQYQTHPSLSHLQQSLGVHYKIDSVINRHLLSRPFTPSRLNFLELMRKHYEYALADALDLHALTKDPSYLDAAYYFSTRTKSIILQYGLNDADALQESPSSPPRERIMALREAAFDLQKLLFEQTGKKDSLLRKYVQAQWELEAAIHQLEEQDASYYQKKYAFISPPTPSEIQQKLPAEVAVVEYFFLQDSLVSFWITQDSFYHIAGPKDSLLRSNISTYTQQCHAPNEALSFSLGYDLYQKLVQPGTLHLPRGIKRLCIIPDGALYMLPFEALMVVPTDESRFLLQDYPLSYGYSSGLLFQGQPPLAGPSYVGFGATYSEGLSAALKQKRRLAPEAYLSPLTLSQREIDMGTQIFTKGQPFLGAEASLEHFYEYAPQAEIIHLALHGLVDYEAPNLSCILFDDHQSPFILSALDLHTHAIQAHLVILSTCQSASGKVYRGEGIQGMSKAFLLSGVQNVLASLWDVSESGSLAIITSFLRDIHQKLPMDLALREAKLHYLQQASPRLQHPYYWANFILIGGPSVHTPTYRIDTSFVVGLLIFLALMAYFLYAKRRKHKRTKI